MNPYQGSSKTVAFFDLETDESITIKGFTLIEGGKGLFVGIPQDKGKDDKYYDKVLFPDNLKRELNEIAVQKYNELMAETA